MNHAGKNVVDTIQQNLSHEGQKEEIRESTIFKEDKLSCKSINKQKGCHILEGKLKLLGVDHSNKRQENYFYKRNRKITGK